MSFESRVRAQVAVYNFRVPEEGQVLVDDRLIARAWYLEPWRPGEGIAIATLEALYREDGCEHAWMIVRNLVRTRVKAVYQTDSYWKEFYEVLRIFPFGGTVTPGPPGLPPKKSPLMETIEGSVPGILD